MVWLDLSKCLCLAMLNFVDNILKFIAEFLSICGDGASSNISPPSHSDTGKTFKIFCSSTHCHSLLSLDTLMCLLANLFIKKEWLFRLERKSKTRKHFNFSMVLLHRFGRSQAVLGAEQNDLHVSAQSGIHPDLLLAVTFRISLYKILVKLLHKFDHTFVRNVLPIGLSS